MIVIYVKKIRDPKNNFTIDDVPIKWREQVREALRS